MRKLILACFIAVFFSFIIIFFAPLTIVEQGTRVGPSPYEDRIDELYLEIKNGVHPEDSRHFEIRELIRKNNEWLSGVLEGEDISTLLRPVEVFHYKSSRVSLLLALIWGLAFYWGSERSFSFRIGWFLLPPFMLFLLDILSFVSMFAIFFSVFVVVFGKILRKQIKPNKTGQP